MKVHQGFSEDEEAKIEALADEIIRYQEAGNVADPTLAELRAYRRPSLLGFLALLGAAALTTVLTSTSLLWFDGEAGFQWWAPIAALVVACLWVAALAHVGKIGPRAAIPGLLGILTIFLVPVYRGVVGRQQFWDSLQSVGWTVGILLLALSWIVARRLRWPSYVALVPLLLSNVLLQVVRLNIVVAPFMGPSWSTNSGALDGVWTTPGLVAPFVAVILLEFAALVGSLLLATRLDALARADVSSSGPINQIAIVAFVLGVLGIGVGAAIAGHIAWYQLRSRGGAGRGFALVALVLGYSGIVFWILMAAIVGPFWITAVY